MGFQKDASTKKIPTRKITSGLDLKTEDSTQKTKEPMAAGAIIGIISGVVSSVSSIWTSSTQLKTKKAEADLIVKEIDLESEKGKSAALVAALEVRKAELARLEAQDKANANIRGLIYAGIFATVGFIAYLMFAPKKTITTP